MMLDCCLGIVYLLIFLYKEKTTEIEEYSKGQIRKGERRRRKKTISEC